MQCEIAMNDAISCSSMSYAKFSDIFSKFGYTNAMFIYGAHCKEIYNIVWKDTIYDDLTDCIHHFGLFEYSIDLLYILLHGVAIFCLEEEVEADAYNRVLKDLKEEHREALIHYVYKKNIKLN